MSTTVAENNNVRPVPAATGNGSEHLSGRIRKKIAGFERIIAGFRQRRWS